MFRLWAKIYKNNKMLDSCTIQNDTADTRTHKVFAAVTELCLRFDLPEPIWLDSNIREFKSRSKTRFTTDSFIEQVPFDYLEIQIIEED